MNEADQALSERLTRALGSAYTVDHEIGRGGMGVVYSARDELLKRTVAIKVLPPELGFREEIRTRFLREAQTAARLSHPHIVPIFSVGQSPDGLVYFVMAYIDGEPLSAKLRRRGRLPPEEVRRVMGETADALAAAHSVGIIHRDVKPDNILLEGSRGRVVVTDFGIAKALSSTTGGATLTGTGVAIGTPHYMSPEQAAGDREIDGRSDVYSLGIVAYQAIVGELPFRAPTVPGVLMKQIMEPAPLITTKRVDCPEDLGAAIMRCLEKDPEDRWPTADALRRALEARSASLPRAQSRAAAIAPPPAPRPVAAGERRPRTRGRGPRRRERNRARDETGASLQDTSGEPRAVRETRASFVRWASITGGLLVFDLVTGSHMHGALLTVSGALAAFSLVPRYVRLWHAGYSWRDVLARPPAADAIQPRGSPPGALPQATTDEFGVHADIIEQVRRDRTAIRRIVDALPPSERRMLPDIDATIQALAKRAEELARVLHTMGTGVEAGAVARLDEKIAAAERQSSEPEVARQLELLRRQRQALVDLITRRRQVEEQLESCGLAMQNVRFDLLRLRSAGVDAVLGDLTHATAQARALSRDVDHAIAAAGEIREALEGGREMS
ncbi:MAG TPA: protein kinase [Gemmatimonadales bacterium]|nr:protein kinase [Gemmatimonadales bacterium]